MIIYQEAKLKNNKMIEESFSRINIQCPTCKGSGKVKSELFYIMFEQIKHTMCLDCKGRGYFENVKKIKLQKRNWNFIPEPMLAWRENEK